MLCKPPGMLQTGVGMLVPAFELFTQLDGQTGGKDVVGFRRPHPDGHGVVDVRDAFVAMFALLVQWTLVHPITTRMKYVPSRIHHLGNFQEHLAHMFVDVPTCANFGIPRKQKEVHRFLGSLVSEFQWNSSSVPE